MSRSLTDLEKENIKILRTGGVGYKRIAKELGLPVSTIQAHCNRNDLEKGELEDPEKQPEIEFCKNCSKVFILTSYNTRSVKKRKKFCSKKCCSQWWKAHESLMDKKAYYTFICPNCKKEFTVYGDSERKYCSRKCLYEHLYGKNDPNRYED